MAIPLMSTKLYVPPLRAEWVPRPRLLARLSAGTAGKLTLISAPAGFGKTTLLSEWARRHEDEATSGGHPPRVAWVSLDRGDNDPARFWAYVIAALQTLQPGLGATALALLPSPPLPGDEAVLTALLNDIAGAPEEGKRPARPYILVFDDYHLIDAQPIHDGVAFLLDHLPPSLHLVIATRSDPPLPLARLRGQGQLAELRARDLRFTADEAAAFLERAVGGELSRADVLAVTARTEGWIVGMQLAALSLQGQDRETLANAIAALTGSQRHILDYLLEEVLQQQPAGVQTFLLQTAILDRLSGPLCEAVTGQGDGQATLERMEKGNLFLVPLDDERRWYRYHHLFADLLRKRLRQLHPDLEPDLHRRASAWHERTGALPAAIDHALAADDRERAAQLIAGEAEAAWGRGEHATLLRWLQALPPTLVAACPHLGVYHAFLLFVAGKYQEAEGHVQAVERALSAAGAPPEPPDPDRRQVQGMAAAVRAYVALFQGDIAATIRFSRQALAALPERVSQWRNTAALALADAHSLSGDMVAAEQALAEAVKASRATGNPFLILLAHSKLAINQMSRGHLRRADEICRQELQLLREKGLSQTAMAGRLYATWGEVLCEWNDLDGATSCMDRALALSGQEGNVAALAWGYLLQVRVLFARQDLAGMAGALQKLEELAQESDVPIWVVNGTAAWKARLWVAQGSLSAAAALLAERGVSANGQPTYLRAAEYLSLVRLLMAQGRWSEAMVLLERLLAESEGGGRTGWVIGMLALEALALQAQGDAARAIGALARALALAEPEGYVRAFADEGPPLARLLYEAAARGVAPEYSRQLLATFPAAPPVAAQQRRTGLIEPLSERERELLRLIAEGLSNQEIAQRLYISLPTVKWHTTNIYGKLGVRSRTQAVARARALGILPTN